MSAPHATASRVLPLAGNARAAIPPAHRSFAALGMALSHRDRLAVHPASDPADRLHTHCVAVTRGGTELQVETPAGVISLTFYPNLGVKEALASLNGVQVTCKVRA